MHVACARVYVHMYAWVSLPLFLISSSESSVRRVFSSLFVVSIHVLELRLRMFSVIFVSLFLCVCPCSRTLACVRVWVCVCGWGVSVCASLPQPHILPSLGRERERFARPLSLSLSLPQLPCVSFYIYLHLLGVGSLVRPATASTLPLFHSLSSSLPPENGEPTPSPY